MNLLNAIETRKSVRVYTEKRVENEKMEAIIKAGNLAPIYGEFHMTVIENPEMLKEISAVTLNMMKNSGIEFLEKAAAAEGYNPLYKAPAMIVLSSPNGNDNQGFNMANVSCAAENMIIQATELGLGTCFVMAPMIAFSNPELAAKLHIPENYVPLVGVLVGYSEIEASKNTREVSKNVTRI